MGNRISIQFKKDKDLSPFLFSHWEGIELVNQAIKYLKCLKKENKNKNNLTPLDRLEPNTVFIDFIRELTKDFTRIKSNYYITSLEKEGDNSDNGNWKIDLNKIDKLEKVSHKGDKNKIENI